MDAPPTRRRAPGRVLLYFVFGLIGLDLVITTHADLWRAYSPDDYRERLQAVRRKPCDVLAVGGSPVAEGIDLTPTIGLPWRGRALNSGYVLGFSGGTTSEFWHALKNGPKVPPRLLVYGITASDLNDRRHEPHGMYSLMTWADLAAWVSSRPDSAEFVTRHFLQARLSQTWQLFRYRNSLRLWAAAQAETWWPGSFPEAAAEACRQSSYCAALHSGCGYAPAEGFYDRRYDLVKLQEGPQKRFQFLENARFGGGHTRYLHRILDWADAHGTDVILLDMPVTADLEAMFPTAFAEYRQLLATLERTRRVTILRATRESVGLTDAYFADLIHLNRAGAALLSYWLRARLAELR